MDVTSASAILSAPDITSSHGVPVNRIGASLVILALKAAMVDEEFHINNLGREYRSRSQGCQVLLVGSSVQLSLDSGSATIAEQSISNRLCALLISYRL